MSRWPLHQAYFWQEAPLFRPLLPLIAGIISYDRAMPGREHLLAAIAALLCSGLLLPACALIRYKSGLVKAGHAFFLHLFFAALGWCAYASGDARNRPDWFGHRPDSTAMAVVRISEAPRARQATTRYTVEALYSRDRNAVKPVCGKALLYLYKSPGAAAYAKGDTLLVPARWQPVRNSGNPFSFDNVAFQGRKGIFFQQFLSPGQVMLFRPADRRKTGFLERAHGWCDHQLRAYIRDTAALGLLQAMLLGDEAGFDPVLREAYSLTGVIHIVSISGSHVAVLFLVVTGLLFWARGRYGAWARYTAGLLLVWLYVLIAGAPPSAIRSAVMFSVLALSVIYERESQPLNTLCAAAFVLLVGEPAWLFSVGFQLSFAAVLSLLLFYKPIYRLWPQTSLAGRALWQAVSASIAAEVLTAPLVAYYFHSFPLLFIPANLLSVVLAGGCALVGGMAVIALSGIPALAGAVGWAVTKLVWLFNAAVLWLQQYNPPAFQYLQISLAELLLLYIVIAASAAWWLARKRQGLPVALAAACVLMALLNRDHYAALRQDRLVVYSNGRQPLVERIRGRCYSGLAGEGAANYNAKAAHTGWHAWRGPVGRSAPFLAVGDKAVFILDDTAVQSFRTALPVDVLVIARPLRRLQPGSALAVFSPKTVVMAGKASPYYLQRWQEGCRARGIRLLLVAERGAYMLE